MSCAPCDQILEAASKTTPCECPVAGFCARHKTTKPAHFHMLCRTQLPYFLQYERGEGPGQNVPRSRFVLGLGDVLEWAFLHLAWGDEARLTAIGIRVDRFIEWISRGRFKAANDGTCNCPKRKAWLNRHFQIWPIRRPGAKP